MTCPAGATTTDYRMARDGYYRPVKLFRFAREVCDRCKLKAENPVRLPPGRQVQMHYHEEALQRARAEQRTGEQKKALRERLRPRAKVERKISEVLRPHGLRRGRYFGIEKTDLQAVMTASMVNAKRLFTLSDGDAKLSKALRGRLAA